MSDLPKYLYHGTTARFCSMIRTHGLRPRGQRSSLWKVASARDRIYLTTAYAGYFAMNAATRFKDSEGIIVEIDTSRLNPDRFVYDEDAIEQITRVNRDPKKGEMLQRTRFFRNRAIPLCQEHPELIRESLTKLGNCAFVGSIPPSAITQIKTLGFRELFDLGDPLITVMNYHLVGWRYRIGLARLFGRDPDPEDLKKFEQERKMFETLSELSA